MNGQEEQLTMPQEERSRKRGGRSLLAALLLLLLLLFTCTTATVSYFRIGPEDVRFVVRNVECLQCHTEMLPSMGMSSIHSPFVRRHCDSCHQDHAKLIRVTASTGAGTATVELRTWLRWGPFRWLIDWVQGVFFRVTEASRRSFEKEAIGEAALTVPVEQLCFTCHAGLSDELVMDYGHRPFTTGRCVDCHDPHASNHGPLLLADRRDLCLVCHRMGPMLEKSVVHEPFGELDCTRCHRPHASDHKGILAERQRELCFGCHTEVRSSTSLAVQHQPFSGDNCTGCHQPHASDHDELLADATPDLCYRCHNAIEPRFARASHHPVGTQLDCPSCHQPHASPEVGLLNAAERELCLGCHRDVVTHTLLPAQHAPFSDDKCTSCHTPHGSKYAPLLRNPEPNLCYQCHPTVARSMTLTSHHPTTCSKCHFAHASQNEGLLVQSGGNAFCYRCHAVLHTSYAASNHRVVACLGCHRPHGSSYATLLKRNGSKTCLTCHSLDLVASNRHRTSVRFYDAFADRPLTCTSSCHDPHSTQYEHMVKRLPWYFDGQCLPCHEAVGIEY